MGHQVSKGEEGQIPQCSIPGHPEVTAVHSLPRLCKSKCRSSQAFLSSSPSEKAQPQSPSNLFCKKRLPCLQL